MSELGDSSIPLAWGLTHPWGNQSALDPEMCTHTSSTSPPLSRGPLPHGVNVFDRDGVAFLVLELIANFQKLTDSKHSEPIQEGGIPEYS